MYTMFRKYSLQNEEFIVPYRVNYRKSRKGAQRAATSTEQRTVLKMKDAISKQNKTIKCKC